ncbi:MAG: hypothetical protein GC182_13305 [Rhodopseudomonas sp.]|nr:hypothetical protein [Rhodopseudomonas sp.]
MTAVAAYRSSSEAPVALRFAVFGLAVAAMAWGFYTFPIFWRQAPFSEIKRHIIAGDPYRPDVLTPFKDAIGDLGEGKWTRPSVLAAAAVVDLRLLEAAIARGETAGLDRLMGETDALVRASLANAPADPFLWTVLFWLENTKDGFKRSRLAFLDMSYRLGPNEGWIAIKRNRFAMALYPTLPAVLASDVVGEFARLVDSNYMNEAYEILSGPGWPVRKELMAGLAGVDQDRRETFARYVYRRGLDVEVPGVVRPEWRPWH